MQTQQTKNTYTTFQPTTIVHLNTDDAIIGDSCTLIKAQSNGLELYITLEQPDSNACLVLTKEEWPIVRTEVERMFQNMALHESQRARALAEKQQQNTFGLQSATTKHEHKTLADYFRAGCTD